MTDEEVYTACMKLAEEIEDSHPDASLIIGVVGCITGGFEPGALTPVAMTIAKFGETALGVMEDNIGE